MRILLLTQWYAPEPVKLISEMAESFRQLGHEVEVLTGFPNYPQGRLYDGYRMRVVRKETIDGIPLVRVPLYADHSRSAIKRIANYLSFALSSMTIGMLATRKPDVILAYGSPYTTAIAAWFHGLIRRRPFVFHVVDLWPESLAASGMVRGRMPYRLAGMFVRWVYRRAARVVTVSNGFRQRIIAQRIPAAKITVVSNWADTEFFAPRASDAATQNEFGLRDKFNVLFAGNLGPAQGIDTIIDAAAALRSTPDIQIVIAGDGIALQGARDRTQQLGLTNVRFLGQLPSSDMPRLFASVDVLLVHLKPHPLYEITIPHKIYAYMASGKAVLAAVQGEAADVVTSANAGLACDAGNAGAMAATIRRFAAMPRAELDRIGANGRTAATSLYSRDTLTRQLAGVLQSAMDERSQRSART